MSAWAVTRGAGATMGSCMRCLPFHPEDRRGPKSITVTPETAKHNSRVPKQVVQESGFIGCPEFFQFREMIRTLSVASLEKLLNEMGQMAKRRITMRRVAAGQYLGHLATGQTQRIEQASHDAGSSTDALCLQPVGNLLGGQIRPHHVLAHGITGGAVFDSVVHLLDQVRLFDFGLFASASWLADATSRRIIGKLLELPHAVFDGLRVASKDLRHVPDAAMAEFDRFECGKASAVLFGQALVILTQQLFDVWAVGLLKVKRHAGSSSRQMLQGMGDPT